LQSVVDHILDLRGMIVPVTLLNISQALREIKPGETVEIIGSDPETKRDLFKILRTFPYELCAQGLAMIKPTSPREREVHMTCSSAFYSSFKLFKIYK